MATDSSTPPAAAKPSPPAQRSSTRPRRNYQACLACKEQKIRCQLGSPDDPQPPCARCRRSRLECVFGPTRGAVRGTRRRRAKDLEPASADLHADAVPAELPSAGGRSNALAVADAASSTGAPPHVEPGSRPAPAHFGQGPSSAMFSERDQPALLDASAIEHHVRSWDLSDWIYFQLCRDGWISPVEAEFLLQCYFRWMQPLFPILDERYQNPSHRKSLITHDHVLCLAILTVASRYVWFEGTSASSRAHEIHTLLFKQAQQGFHNSLWGVEHDAAQESRVLSTVESIMLFVEWRPRPMDVMPNYGLTATDMDVPGVDRDDSQNCVIDEETQKAYLFARRMNATSWRLLGHAIHLLDEIGLVEGLSKSKESRQHDAANLRRRARIRDLLVPLVWEVAFRLGRESLLKLPKSAGAEEYSGENVFSPLLSSRAELYRLCRLIENTLYSSASATKDIIASDRHPEMVSSLAEIMHDWRNKFQKQPGPLALRKSIEIQYNSVWTYLHAISFQAIVERLRHSSGNEAGIQHFERSYQPQRLSIAEVLRSERSRRDIQSTDEIAKASIRALELTLELEHEGYLRFIPSSTMIHISTSATLLLKGLRTVTDRSTLDLLSRLSHAMHRAAVDDAHAMAHFSSGLSSILKKLQAGAPTVYRNGRQYSSTAQDTANINQPGAINLPPIGAENAGVANGAVSEQASFAGAGGVFDPIFPDDIAEDWANWLSVGLDDIDSCLGLNLYSSCGIHGEILRL